LSVVQSVVELDYLIAINEPGVVTPGPVDAFPNALPDRLPKIVDFRGSLTR